VGSQAHCVSGFVNEILNRSIISRDSTKSDVVTDLKRD